MSDRSESVSHLLRLPAELREQIYRLILSPAATQVSGPDEYDTYDYNGAVLRLFLVNRQVYYESRAAFRALNIFVKIKTPWPEAQDRVQAEGHVPILLKGKRAAQFSDHTLAATITVPLIGGFAGDDNDNDNGGANGGDDGSASHIVILLDDLPKFTRTWFYSDLSNPGLNRHLGLRLHVREPYLPPREEESEEKRALPEALQHRLLLPFGEIKSLYRFEIVQEPSLAPLSASIKAELRALQSTPPAGPEKCLDEAARLKAEGNELLKAENPRAALEVYRRAWEAMHIVVRGRQRHVHAEVFFARRLGVSGGSEGQGQGQGQDGEGESRWRGKNGAMERLILRVQLVANTCLAYLKLKQWDEVCFWGMRSIGMMRQARLAANGATEYDTDVAPEDEAVVAFPAAIQMGKIYYRTGVALKELGDKAAARKLLRVASLYLPRDEHVKRELAACALMLG